MSWIVTANGDELDLRVPQPQHITVWAIAWSLGQIVRFNGHALRPYSVAEHSLLVCEIAERELGLQDIHALLAALMHDAHEAWCGDMHTPGKDEIGPAWHAFESRHERATRRAFAIVTPSAVFRDLIKLADLIALATERRDLMPQTPTPWTALHGVEPVAWVDLASPERRRMNWEDWRDRWLDRYHELEFARNEAMFPQMPSA